MNTYRYELATQFMRDNFSSKLTLEAVAERLFISSRQLQRIFRHCSGSGFSEMLERIRIEHVCRKLAHSVETIEEIAETSGFTSASYLYTVFKKHTGLTPRQYKEDQNRKEG